MKPLLTLALITLVLSATAQKKTTSFPKFGLVNEQYLKIKEYEIDKEAGAVILSKKRDLAVTGNEKGGFSLENHFHSVIHILKQKSYDEAVIEIPLYKDGQLEEKVTAFKATTYNLEGEKVQETTLKKSDIFYEKVDKNRSKAKFSMPQVKEGSIIEFDYTTTSDFIMVPDPWYFQSLSAPVLWSEMTFTVPEFFTYRNLQLGYHPMHINEKKDAKLDFNISEYRSAQGSNRIRFRANVAQYRWVMVDIPELKAESFTRSIKNHIARMEFLLMGQRDPLLQKSYTTTWEQVINDLNEAEYFGQKLNTNNNWLGEELKPLYSKAENQLEKAKFIYAFVRDGYGGSEGGGIYLKDNLKSVFKAKKGTPAELNLLLTAMLRYANIQANPVLLSTSEHGYAYDYTPMLTSMNYVIVEADIEGKKYYLDASKSKLGFNRLPLNCYNGNARVINHFATPLTFSSDSLKESNTTQFYLLCDSTSKWSGYAKNITGYYKSYNIRNELGTQSSDEYLKNIQKNYPQNMLVSNLSIDSLDNLDAPVIINYNIEMIKNNDDFIYLNPTFNEGLKNNPFTAETRSYPVEMPYVIDEMIMSTIEIPANYELEELPKQSRINLDESGQNYFEYLISASGNIISFRNILKLNKTFFMADEYPALREFFMHIAKKQNEQVVLKKKK